MSFVFFFACNAFEQFWTLIKINQQSNIQTNLFQLNMLEGFEELNRINRTGRLMEHCKLEQ